MACGQKKSPAGGGEFPCSFLGGGRSETVPVIDALRRFLTHVKWTRLRLPDQVIHDHGRCISHVGDHAFHLPLYPWDLSPSSALVFLRRRKPPGKYQAVYDHEKGEQYAGVFQRSPVIILSCRACQALPTCYTSIQRMIASQSWGSCSICQDTISLQPTSSGRGLRQLPSHCTCPLFPSRTAYSTCREPGWFLSIKSLTTIFSSFSPSHILRV